MKSLAIVLLALVILTWAFTPTANAGRCSVIYNSQRVYIDCPKDNPTPTPVVRPVSTPVPTPAVPPVKGWKWLRQRLPR